MCSMKRIMRQRMKSYGLLILPVAAWFMMGCATLRDGASGEEVSIVLQARDQVMIDDRQMTAQQVAERLRSQRVATDTLIKIERGAGATEQAMALLLGTLQQAGYTRVVFVSPRHIEIEVP